MNNLVLLCSHHHDEHHKGTYLITGNPTTPKNDGGTDPKTGLVFTYPNTGKPITLDPPEHWKPPQQRTNPDPYQAPTGEAFTQQWVHFTPNHN